MRVPRFYTDQTLAPDQSILLEADPSHHLLNVLRLHPGDAVLLFNGDGCEYHALIDCSEGKRARLTIYDVSEPRRESALRISLGQGVSRTERMDLVVQKAVELGVSEMTPLWTRRSRVKLSGQRLEKRLSHWRGIALSACEQSGRVRLPILNNASGLAEWLVTATTGSTGIILDPTADMTLRDIDSPSSVCVLIGPEGGLAQEEINMAIAAGFRPARLGPRTLRTETAALATLAALQTLWGDFNH